MPGAANWSGCERASHCENLVKNDRSDVKSRARGYRQPKGNRLQRRLEVNELRSFSRRPIDVLCRIGRGPEISLALLGLEFRNFFFLVSLIGRTQQRLAEENVCMPSSGVTWVAPDS